MSELRYITERTRAWKSQDLTPKDSRCVSDIEKYGSHLIHVSADDVTPAWSYSVGAFDTGCAGELVVTGMPSDTAHSVINEAIELMRNGVDLLEGRHADLLESVDCVFRPLDPKWSSQLMNWTNWYYGIDSYPAFQCIYPDFAGIFPWEDGFDERWRSRQPLLFAGAEESVVERDLWSANDPESSLFAWKFSDSPHTRTFSSDRVSKNLEPITYVSHDHGEGDWQFHGDSMSEGKPPVILCLHCIVDRDPSIVELADLPIGWYAEREHSGAPWVRGELDPALEED